MKFLCFGMAVCDYILSGVPTDILSINGASVSGLNVRAGGDALNVAIGVTRLGNQAAIVGRVGRDASAEFLRERCRTEGVDGSGLVTDKDYPTSTSFVLLDRSGERHFLFENRIYANYSEEMVLEKWLRDADCVYFGSALTFPSLDQGGIAKLFARAKKLGKTTAMDAALHGQKYDPRRLDAFRPALEATDIFFPSLAEIEVFTDTQNPYKAAEIFRDTGVKILGIKLGNKGAYVTDFSEERIVPPRKSGNVVDTTGAGDAFFAGFLSARMNGFSPFESVEIGNITASRAIEAIGATAGIPSFDRAVAEATAFYRKSSPATPEADP